jgi:hypothetical protein
MNNLKTEFFWTAKDIIKFIYGNILSSLSLFVWFLFSSLATADGVT